MGGSKRYLKYRTRGDSTPQGKPRVYYTGHPVDMPLFLDSIASDILEAQNCAIYYDPQPLDPQGWEEWLPSMQLVVIPITRRFLTEPSRAMEKELPFIFSMKTPIPLLPLAQEPGLGSLLKQKLGQDLQLLGRMVSSDSQKELAGQVLSYEQKLKQFLSSILIGDAQAELVRSAFTAHIFLSYRKVDRKYAQDLMAQIHQPCPDIAIWYDEFLVPGKSFREGISKAMDDSKFVALAVTPNLLERREGKKNFVMGVEYPMAQQAGKPVFPVMLLPTDQRQLCDEYENLPACVDAQDQTGFRAALLETLRKLNIHSRDDSPERRYLIGLAYLNGIDVEVDRPRAVKLITSAAEAGCPPAIEQLVGMYRQGVGVERSYQTAILWQKRLVSFLADRFNASHTESNGLELAKALLNLAYYCDTIWDKQQAISFCTQARDLAGSIAQATGSRSARKILATACDNLGMYCNMERRFEEAWNAYVQALETNQSLWEEKPSHKAAMKISLCYARLSGIRYSMGQLKESADLGQQALAIAQQLYKEKEGTQERSWLAYVCNRMGIVLRAMGSLDRAEDLHRESLTLYTQLHQELRDSDAAMHMAECHNYLGNIYTSKGQPAEALRHFQEFAAISQSLFRQMRDAASKRNLAVAYGKLGNVFRDMGQTGEAEKYYAEQVGLSSQLAEESGTAESRRLLGVGLEHLGNIALARGDAARAKKLLQQALQVELPLCQELGTPESLRNPAILYDSLVRIAQQEGDLAAARSFCMEGLKLRERMMQLNRTTDTLRGMAISWETLAALEEQGGSREAEKIDLQAATALRIEIFEANSHSSRAARELADCCWKLLPLCEGAEERERSLKVLIVALREADGSAAEIADALLGLISICREQGRLEETLPFYQECLEIYRQLWQETGDPRVRRRLIQCSIDGGTMCARLGNAAAAQGVFRDAVDLAEQAAKEENTVSSYDDLALAYARLGSVTAQRECLLRAYSIWDQLSKLDARFVQDLEYARQLLERLDGRA